MSTSTPTFGFARSAGGFAASAIPVVSVTCFAVHVVLLVATGTSMLTMAVAMLVLSGLCVACTWRAGSTNVRRDHAVATAGALTMIVMHLLLMPTASGRHDTDHAAMGHAGMQMVSSHEGVPSSGVVDALMNAGLALALVQVVLSAGAALRPTRRSIA